MESLIVKSRLDKEYVLNNGKSKNVVVQVNLEASKDLVASTNRGTHFCIVLDVSGSMYWAIDKIENLKNENKKIIENKAAIAVSAEEFPGTIDIALNSIKKLFNKLGPKDKVSLITYNEDAKIIFERCSITDKAFMISQLNKVDEQPDNELAKFTNISTSLHLANEVLSKYEQDNRKIIFLTDGRPSFNEVRNGKPVDTIEECIAASNSISNSSIAIDYIGLECTKFKLKDSEELDFAFLEELSKKSNGSVYLVKDEESCDVNFSTIINNSKKASIPRAKLKLQLNSDIDFGDYYMVQPQNKYCGKLIPNKNRIVTIDLNEISKDKTYSFLCSLNINTDKYTNVDNIELMKVKADYTVDVNDTQEIRKTPVKKVLLSIGNDKEKAMHINGSVKDSYEIATIKKYEREYQYAYKNKQRAGVIYNIEKIIDIYEEQGEKELADINRKLLLKYKQEGLITQEDINKQSNLSTTVKTEVPVITGRPIKRKIRVSR